MQNRTLEVDTIRGLALFGICVVNVPFLAAPWEELLQPKTGTDFWVTLAVELLFQGKFFVLFSFLFGWGFAIQMASAQKNGQPFAQTFMRRLLGLLVIGVLHATLVFNGDILVLYALLGLALYALRNASAATLLKVTAITTLCSMLLLALLGAVIQEPATATTYSGPGYLGGFFDAATQRVQEWPVAAGFILFFNGATAFAAFCVGLAAAKSGFFNAGSTHYQWVRNRVWWLLAAAVPLNCLYALSMSGLITHEFIALAGFAGLAIGGPLLATVYLVGAIEAARRGWFRSTTVAAGRMSLTAYILEGILAGLIFNGYGLGYYGQVGAAGCFLIAVAIYFAVHLFCALWLRAFAQGPLEAVLRTITRGGIR